MASKNNVIEEIKELIQKIKNEYQEGVDFAFVAPSLINRASGGYRVKIISPRLKKFCREKFSLSSGVNYHLDYEKGDQEGNDFYYRICVDNNDYDVLDCVKDELYRFNDNSEEPKKCKTCGELDSYENGRIVMWSGRKIGGFLNPSPNIISYFHPECAKKYFADKAQPNENNVRIKEKLLRNLDKICLDPYGYLANNECLKTDEAEEEYQKTFNLPYQREWKNRYLKIIIDGEEIDLYDFDNASNEYYEAKRELVKKIKQEIKQNPFEWKIEWGKNENYVDKSLNQLVKHQPSGRRYWKLAINQYWAEIETALKNSGFPVIDNSPNKSNSTSTETEKRWYKPKDYPFAWTIGSISVALCLLIAIIFARKRIKNKYIMTLITKKKKKQLDIKPQEE
ncbi:MAG: hypothetical protein MRERV_6c034 [Mycoplasmataceae bacterium RV_VA103A]|nr:MAG: hypothetical protein MRERV_6c034 [Mycoplasmataceae bacterium RV_VA103A]